MPDYDDFCVGKEIRLCIISIDEGVIFVKDIRILLNEQSGRTRHAMSFPSLKSVRVVERKSVKDIVRASEMVPARQENI